MPRRPAWAIPVACVLAALAMRLWALRYQPFVTVDGTDYIAFAESLARGQIYRSIFPPGYPALIAAAHMLVPDRVLAAALVSLVAGALLPWPVWILARKALGERGAWLPALMVALHPELARFGAMSMSESSYVFALFLGLALAVEDRPLGAGLALGSAFAIRPEALVIGAALAVREGMAMVRHRRSARVLLRGLAGFLILALPCWLYFHAALGQWTLTPKLGAFHATVADWRTIEPRLAPAAAPDTTRSAVVTALTQYPAHLLGHVRSLLKLWPAPLALLSAIGLPLAPGWAALPLLHLLLIPLLGLSAQLRFVLPALPALALLASIALQRGWRAGSARAPAWRIAAVATALAGAVWCGMAGAGRFITPLDNWLGSHQRAGLWLSGVAEPGALVMDRKPFVAFYAHRIYRVIPDDPYEQVVAAAVGQHVRYLVVDQSLAEVYRKQLEPLLYDAEFRDRESRLELIYVGGGGKGYGLGIFRVLQPGESKSGQPPYVDPYYLHSLSSSPGP